MPETSSYRSNFKVDIMNDKQFVPPIKEIQSHRTNILITIPSHNNIPYLLHYSSRIGSCHGSSTIRGSGRPSTIKINTMLYFKNVKEIFLCIHEFKDDNNRHMIGHH